MTFKVGDKVRINCPLDWAHGLTGEIREVLGGDEVAVGYMPANGLKYGREVVCNVKELELMTDEESEKLPEDTLPEIGSEWVLVWSLHSEIETVVGLPVNRKGETKVLLEDEDGYIRAMNLGIFRQLAKPHARKIKRGQVWLDKLTDELVVIHVAKGMVHALDRGEVNTWKVNDFRKYFTYIRDVEIQEEEL